MTPDQLNELELLNEEDDLASTAVEEIIYALRDEWRASTRLRARAAALSKAVCLLNSMVACGESHSDVSLEVVRKALAGEP